MSTIQGLLMTLIAMISTTKGSQINEDMHQNCGEAQKLCISQLGCQMALNNYLLNCSPLIYGETSECSRDCQQSLISLLSIESGVGEKFMTCDCGDNEVCVKQKGRINVCYAPVMHAMQTLFDDKVDINCNLATLICVADSPCFMALRYYDTYCKRLVTGERCTEKCNNSLSILYRTPRAHKLRTCICDGTENYNCERLRENTHRLCINRVRGGRRHRNHTAPPIQRDDYDYSYREKYNEIDYPDNFVATHNGIAQTGSVYSKAIITQCETLVFIICFSLVLLIRTFH